MRWLAAIAGLWLWLAPGTGLGDEPVEAGNGDGMALRLFRPAIDSTGFFTVDGAAVLGHGSVAFGLVADAGLGQLRLGGAPVVDGIYTGELSLHLGLGDLATVGVALPVVIAQGEVPRGAEGLVGAREANRTAFAAQGVGDVDLQGKLRLLRPDRSGVGLAALLRVGLPSGDARSFLGEPGVSVSPGLAVEARPHRRVRLALDGGARLVLGDGSTVGGPGHRVRYGHQLTAGLGVSFGLLPGSVDLVGEALASTLVAQPFARAATPVEVVGGLKIFVERRSYLTLGAGRRVGAGYSAADLRLFVGFVFEPSVGDRDGDGLLDDVDRCPAEPEDHDDFEDEDGCPEPDDDRDSILDVDDECRRIPEDRDGVDDGDGCPDSDPGDRDGDRLLDEVDGCPDEPEDVDGWLDPDGCPDPDNDGDRIPDVDDLCPDEPEDADGWQDPDGCPDRDNDGDRILDVDDRCPNEPETYNGSADEDGCPDEGVVHWDGDSLVSMEPIHFQTDSAVIQRRSFRLLDAIAAALRGNPQLRLVEVSGHADERGDDEYNLQLTNDRAAAVVEALGDRSVERARMRFAGYGERCPRDVRHGAAAWARNRRVDITIVETDRGPTGAEVGCAAARGAAGR